MRFLVLHLKAQQNPSSPIPTPFPRNSREGCWVALSICTHTGIVLFANKMEAGSLVHCPPFSLALIGSGTRSFPLPRLGPAQNTICRSGTAGKALPLSPSLAHTTLSLSLKLEKSSSLWMAGDGGAYPHSAVLFPLPFLTSSPPPPPTPPRHTRPAPARHPPPPPHSAAATARSKQRSAGSPSSRQ